MKQLTRQRGYTDQMVDDANAVIFTFGSCRLGVSLSFSLTLSYLFGKRLWLTWIMYFLLSLGNITEIKRSSIVFVSRLLVFEGGFFLMLLTCRFTDLGLILILCVLAHLMLTER